MSILLEVRHLKPEQLFDEYGGFYDEIDRRLFRSYENFALDCCGKPVAFMSVIVTADDPDDEDDTRKGTAVWWEIIDQKVTLQELVPAIAEWLWENWQLPMEMWSHRDDQERKVMLRESGFRLFRAINDPTWKACPWRFRYSGTEQ